MSHSVAFCRTSPNKNSHGNVTSTNQPSPLLYGESPPIGNKPTPRSPFSAQPKKAAHKPSLYQISIRLSSPAARRLTAFPQHCCPLGNLSVLSGRDSAPQRETNSKRETTPRKSHDGSETRGFSRRAAVAQRKTSTTERTPATSATVARSVSEGRRQTTQTSSRTAASEKNKPATPPQSTPSPNHGQSSGTALRHRHKRDRLSR